MKIVALDVGNSHVKAGCFTSRGLIRKVWPHSPEGIHRCARQIERWRPTVIGMVSVVPRLNASLSRAIRRRTGLAPKIIRPQARGGMEVRYGHPAQLGADRYANAVGAWHAYGGPCVVVDIGTAITVDAVSGKGAFVGGAILPGPFLMMRALKREAAQLPLAAPGIPRRVIGRSTVECLQSGVGFGVIGAIELLTGRMKRTLGGRPSVILTGGGAVSFKGRISGVTRYDPHLTLKGIAWLIQNGIQDKKLKVDRLKGKS